MPNMDDDSLVVRLERYGTDADAHMNFYASRQLRGRGYNWATRTSAHPTNEELKIAFAEALDSFSKAAEAEK